MVGQNINIRAEFDSTFRIDKDPYTIDDEFGLAQILLASSKSRKKRGWWASFPWSKGNDRTSGTINVWNNRTVNETFEMRGRGNADRRYQFRIKVTNRQLGPTTSNDDEEMTIWFPSSTTYTSNTTLDLGNLYHYFRPPD